MSTGFTVVDEGRVTTVDAQVEDGRVLVRSDDVERATGWQHQPEGMCREGVCIPLRDPAVQQGDRLDLTRLAAALRRPFALDTAESVAYLGPAAADRAEPLASLRAPDFTLPDLDGRLHTLGAQRGKKVLLVAYASW
jgi:hypothetical protein